MGRQNRSEPYTMPVVVRAREYHLYDDRGKRYIDFFQNHGRAVLGHRPEGVLRSMKAVASRGLLAEYPSRGGRRLEQLLEQLLPGVCGVRLYRDRLHARLLLSEVFGMRGAPLTPADPAVRDIRPGEPVSWWRPFLGDARTPAQVLIPILPFPGDFLPEVVCAMDPAVAEALPPSDAVSPFLVDLLVRSAAALIVKIRETKALGMIENPLKGLVARTCGIYGLSGLSGIRYQNLHASALDGGVVLPPESMIPMICPLSCSDGELKPLLDALRSISGESG